MICLLDPKREKAGLSMALIRKMDEAFIATAWYSRRSTCIHSHWPLHPLLTLWIDPDPGPHPFMSLQGTLLNSLLESTV